MAVTEVLDDKGKFLVPHMVTIVGYDALYYYSAYGKDVVAAIPKTEFEIKNPSSGTMKYNLYIYNGKKRLNR